MVLLAPAGRVTLSAVARGAALKSSGARRWDQNSEALLAEQWHRTLRLKKLGIARPTKERFHHEQCTMGKRRNVETSK